MELKNYIINIQCHNGGALLATFAINIEFVEYDKQTLCLIMIIDNSMSIKEIIENGHIIYQ